MRRGSEVLMFKEGYLEIGALATEETNYIYLYIYRLYIIRKAQEP